MTLRKPKKVLSLIIALTMLLTLLPATLGFAATEDIEAFVTRLYVEALDRQPEAEGLAYWVNELETGNKTAAQVVGFILVDAPEFAARNLSDDEFMDVVYKAFLNREPDDAGKAFWMSKLDEGYSRRWIMSNMMTAPTQEFQDFCAANNIKVGKIGFTGADLPPAVPDELEVEAVTAINLKQVAIEFNMDVEDNDDATNKDNYEISDVELASVDVSDDIVVLNIKDGDEVDNQASATLTIAKEVLGEEKEIDIEFFDITPPTAIKAEVVGSDTVKVYFSEPIKAATKDDFEINDGDYFIKKVELFENNTQVNITTYSDFDEDEIEVKVESSIEDFAGFNMISRTFAVDVVEDEDAPVIIGYEDATTDEVTLIFNEDIIIDDENAANFYHTNDKNPAIDYELVDGNKIKLIFADTDDTTEDVPLPEGIAYVYVKGDTVVDLWGNVAENTITVKIEVTKDTEAPAVDEVEALSQSEIKVTFTENVFDGAEDESNYTVLKDGEEFEVDKAEADGKIVTLTMGDDLDYGTYKLVIEDVEDKSGNKMEKTTVEFDVDDTTPPTFPTTEEDIVLYDLSDDGKDYNEYKIVINYDESMSVDGKYSVLDAANYTLVAGGSEYVLDKLDDYAGISDVSVSIKSADKNKVVEILIEAKGLVLDADDSIIIARVADSAGNYTTDLSSGEIGYVDGSTRYVTFTAEAIDTDEIKVKFSDNLIDFEGSDLLVVSGANKADIEAIIADPNIDTDEDGVVETQELVAAFEDADLAVGKVRTVADDEAVYTLEDTLNYDASFGTDSVFVIAIDNDSVNRYDEGFEIGKVVAVDDKIAPAVDEDNVVAEGKIVKIPFKEAVKEAWLGLATFEVEDNTVVGYEYDSINNVLYLELSEDVQAGNDVTQVAPIYDGNDNKTTGLSFDIEEIDNTVEEAYQALQQP